MTQESLYLPLCSFPSLHWYALATRENTRILLHEYYTKQTYRNRYDILGVNGKLTLTIPVEGQKGVKTPFTEIRIAGNSWRKLHLRSIRSAYGRAAFFEYYFDDLEKVIGGNQTSLHDFNMESLQWASKAGMPINFLSTTEKPELKINPVDQLLEPSYVWPDLPSYPQVFSDRFPFQSGLSSIDLIMNRGPQSAKNILDAAILP